MSLILQYFFNRKEPGKRVKIQVSWMTLTGLMEDVRVCTTLFLFLKFPAGQMLQRCPPFSITPQETPWNEYRVCRSLLSVILWISKQLGTPAFFLLWSHCSYVNWTWNQCIYRKHPRISRTLNLAAQILGKKEKKRSLFFLHQKKSSLIHPLFIET